MANIIDEKLFQQILGHKFETLGNELINTTNKEENQIIVKNIDKNEKKWILLIICDPAKRTTC